MGLLVTLRPKETEHAHSPRHRMDGDGEPKSILLAFAIGSCFYGMAFLLTFADRIGAPSLVQPAFAQSGSPPMRADATRLHSPDESVEDARLKVDQWSYRLGCERGAHIMMKTISAALLMSAMLVFQTARSADPWTEAIEALGDYNYPRAMPLIRQSAAEGNMRAQEMLGLMMIHGEALYVSATHPDRAEALQWLARAAGQGSEVAQDLLRSWARRGHADAVQALARAGMRP